MFSFFISYLHAVVVLPVLFGQPHGWESGVWCQTNDCYCDIFAAPSLLPVVQFWTGHHKDKERANMFVQQALNTQRAVTPLEPRCRINSSFKKHSWDKEWQKMYISATKGVMKSHNLYWQSHMVHILHVAYKLVYTHFTSVVYCVLCVW